MKEKNSVSLKIQIKNETNKCVKCGLCTTVCPTYQLTKEEGENPRGRIALMEGLALEKLSATPKLVSYLNHCLNCRACEIICPAEVSYSTLIQASKSLLYQEKKQSKPLFILNILKKNKRIRWLSYLLFIYQRLGIQALVRKSGLLKASALYHYDAIIPTLSKPKQFENFYYPQNIPQGNIALFINCINPLFETKTIHAVIELLTKIGYGVYIPSAQTCCGALALEQGDENTAYQFLKENEQAFSEYKVENIISFTSACALTLKEYQYLVNEPHLQTFAKKVIHIDHFLSIINWPENIFFTPLQKKVLIHQSCTLKNGLKEIGLMHRFLSLIPELTIINMPIQQFCCGASGKYFLEYPDTASKLLQPIIDYAEKEKPDYFLTSNIGCQLHIARALKSIPISHPIELLVQQLQLKTSHQSP
ncbi:MAG: Lactate utilization protein A [Legionellaceae bacterium]